MSRNINIALTNYFRLTNLLKTKWDYDTDWWANIALSYCKPICHTIEPIVIPKLQMYGNRLPDVKYKLAYRYQFPITVVCNGKCIHTGKHYNVPDGIFYGYEYNRKFYYFLQFNNGDWIYEANEDYHKLDLPTIGLWNIPIVKTHYMFTEGFYCT